MPRLARCSAINSLTQDQRDTIKHWMRECPPTMFKEVIVALQQFITIYVNEYRCIDDHVASATKVLGILWGTNQVCASSCEAKTGV